MQLIENEPVMYLIVNKELGMRPGKIGAQTGHAVAGILFKYYKSGKTLTQNKKLVFEKWAGGGNAKIVLKANSEEWVQLKKFIDWDTDFIVRDEGRTQIESGSETVIGIFPMSKNETPAIIKNMSLL